MSELRGVLPRAITLAHQNWKRIPTRPASKSGLSVSSCAQTTGATSMAEVRTVT
ncbi:hypothetical protein [Marinobacter panjinensis]|uniref:hypothetical protein n=1 Tax=Marinobacter panjinensis TaxID=2576384 RepID=UPI001485A025|nr:hypothetical protein [Marinobacter panjinensis]MCR8914502.1 hypothetical protein [Marinobacter panjinensis]